MRDKLIKKIVDLSVKVDNDDLEWFEFNKYSNDELLEMYRELVIVEYMDEQDEC